MVCLYHKYLRHIPWIRFIRSIASSLNIRNPILLLEANICVYCSSELTKSLTFTVFNILCTQYSSRLSTNNMMMIMMIMADAQKNSINIVLCLTYVFLWNMITKNFSLKNISLEIYGIFSFSFWAICKIILINNNNLFIEFKVKPRYEYINPIKPSLAKKMMIWFKFCDTNIKIVLNSEGMTSIVYCLYSNYHFCVSQERYVFFESLFHIKFGSMDLFFIVHVIDL